MDEPLYTIGDLARRTGVPVKRIRFYSDLGVVPPADRGRAGYRLYDVDASTPAAIRAPSAIRSCRRSPTAGPYSEA